MPEIVVQASFNSGEWSPNLYARVDITKYRSGAALLENFFIDYRGGASTRMGSKYVLQAYKSATAVRLITFQLTATTGYALELGDQYMRFYFNGSPILETGLNITGITQANPAVVSVVNTFAAGDWVYISGVNGMTQVDGRYFRVNSASGTTVTLGDLNGNAINSTAYGAYTSGGTIQRIYTIATPWAAADLALLKFAQIQDEMVFVHPSYNPRLLTIFGPTNWVLSNITFGPTVTAPGGVSLAISLGSGTTHYAYCVTSIDANGQESEPSAVAHLDSKGDIATTAGTVQISWTAVTGAVAYNVYKAAVSLFGVLPAGVPFGFIGTCKGTVFIDTNIIPDFTETPPVNYNPFSGNGVAFVTVTAAGTYTSVPTANTSGGSPAVAATLQPALGVSGLTVVAAGTGFAVGDSVNFGNSVVATVSTIGAGGAVTGLNINYSGYLTSGGTPSNPMPQASTSGSGTGLTVNATSWGVVAVNVLATGNGYLSTPSIVFGSGAATATATLSANSNGNPSTAAFFQQRLVLAAPTGAPNTFYMSQPGFYFNFDINSPVQADDSITETLVSRTAETVKWLVSVSSGLLTLTDQGTWLITGSAGPGTAISPTSIIANRQSNFGSNDVPPITTNFDTLYVTSKGSAVRDVAYNIYYTTYASQDISITSSHLFFGYTIREWAWAESPFYVVWAVRNDGVMLTLTFLKDQEFVGWSHQVTNGLYKSTCAVTEATSNAGNVDAVYTVVQRTVNGNTVQYIERISDRVFPSGLSSAWCVDAGIQYTGTAALSFTGAEHLAGLSVTGLATDNLGNVTVITPFTMPVNGFFTLPAPVGGATGYTTVTLGLAFTCSLQTLAIDVGSPPIQGKLKKIPSVMVRVKDTVGISIGGDFNSLVPMKDTVPGNVSSALTGLSSQVVSGLYSGDAYTIINPSYNIYGQYCIQQSQPYPATILGVFPTLVMGDSD